MGDAGVLRLWDNGGVDDSNEFKADNGDWYVLVWKLDYVSRG